MKEFICTVPALGTIRAVPREKLPCPRFRVLRREAGPDAGPHGRWTPPLPGPHPGQPDLLCPADPLPGPDLRHLPGGDLTGPHAEEQLLGQ